MELISVIVPIYNSERYLKQCLDSIVLQEYSDLEIILINDGSTDNSGDICEQYAKLDQRIVVVHKVNEGQAAARNIGLNIAKGQYITFVDSDDFLETNAYKSMIETIRYHEASVVMMKTNIVDENNFIVNCSKKENVGLRNNKDYITSLLNYEGSASVWDKLFKKEIFANKRFKNVLNEDFLLLIEIFVENNYDIYESDILGYNYRINEGSTTRSGFNKAIIDSVHNAKNAEKLILSKYPDLLNECKRFTLFQLRTFLALIPVDQMVLDNEPYKVAHDLLKENESYILKANIDFMSKMFLLLFVINPKFAKFICNALMRIFNK